MAGRRELAAVRPHEESSQRARRFAPAADEEFRLLVEGVKDYAIFLLDRDGHVLTWNAGAERIKQYTPDEILGEHFSRFYEPQDQAAGRPARILEAAAREGRFEGYGWRVRKDGTRFFAHVTLTALYDEGGELHGFAKVTQDVTAQREAERQLAEAQVQADLSRRLQSGLLPVLSLRDSALVLRTRYLPGHERALLGADFFDELELPDGTVAALIGDVAGHGPGEAAVGVALRAAWRALILAGHGPADVLDGLDKVLVSNRPSEEMFATVCCLWVRPERHRIMMALAGHPPPLLADEGKVEVVDVEGGPALGILEENHPWEAGELEVGDAWTLLCYTDGLFEGLRAPGSVERFGIEALRETAARLLEEQVSVDGLLDGVLEVVLEANGQDLSDDVAILCLATSDQVGAPPPRQR
jgi:PAS domain S-box-containing protein